MIYGNAIRASINAYQLQMISTTYVEISQKHFVHQLASLQKLTLLDPASNADQIKQYASLKIQ